MNESRDTPWGAYPVYRPVRRIPTAALVATLAVLVVNHTLFWMVAPVANALDAIETWSGSLVQSSLTGNAMRLVALVALWFGAFGMRPRDVGIQPASASAGLRVLVGGWLVIQVIRMIGAVVAGDGLVWSARIESGHGAWILGAVLGQVLGTALVEEVVYRGLFIPQLYVRIGADSERRRVMWALVLGGAIFALNHIPMLADRGYRSYELVGPLVVLAAAGCFYAAIYLRTGNLFVAMAVHALTNVSGDIVASPIDGRVLAFVLGLGCLVCWPRERNRLTASDVLARR